MKSYLLVNAGLEQLTQQDLKEQYSLTSTSPTSNVVECDTTPQTLINLATHLQTPRRILLAIGKFKTPESISFSSLSFPLTDIFTNETSFKIEVENFPGIDNRLNLAKTVAGKLYATFQSLSLNPKLDLKRPQILLLIFYSNDQYFVGIDITGKELNSRPYRLFPHQSSFKGDLAYFFIRQSKFQSPKKLLVGFAKDGSLAIEAAIYTSRTSLQDPSSFSCQAFPSWKNLSSSPSVHSIPQLISVFDETTPNITAIRKNSYLAKVEKFLNISKHSLDELDTKYDPQSFDTVIFHITSKDEEKINDLYYGLDYILKPQSNVLIIGRPGWEFPLSSKFLLLEQKDIIKGDSTYRTWLLQKK
jgi:23S rRNA G2445 N2-methylase RlmL